MEIVLTKKNKETGETKEIFKINDEKIKEYLVKAGTFIFVNGIVGRLLPAKRNIGLLLNAGMSYGITKMIFDEFCGDDTYIDKSVDTCTVTPEPTDDFKEVPDEDDDLK